MCIVCHVIIFLAAYLDFIFDRIKDKNPDGSLQIMYDLLFFPFNYDLYLKSPRYTIHGEPEFPYMRVFGETFFRLWRLSSRRESLP
jgi:hypothetical protein